MLPMKAGLPARALKIVPYLTPDEVSRLSAACRGRQRDRDALLLLLLLFQTGLRISEVLSLTVAHLSRQPGALEIVGKGGKPRLVACPAPLAHRLKAYAFDRGLGPGDRLFPMGRKRAWQVIGAATAQAGLAKRVYPHLFRHSGAIERLRQTGNPRALQLHLGHASPLMTMRYLSTLTAEEALRINQAVRFED
jgi:integrase/recombinase XerD